MRDSKVDSPNDKEISRSGATRDLIIILMLLLVAIIIGGFTNFFQTLIFWPIAFNNNLVVILFILTLSFAFYGYRRWQEFITYENQLRTQDYRTRRLSNQQTILYEVLRSAAEHLDIEETLRMAVETLNKYTGWSNISIALTTDTGETTWSLKAVSGLLENNIGDTFTTDYGVIGRTFRTGQAQLVPDVTRDLDYLVVHPAIRSSLNMPMARNGRILGVLSIESVELAAFNIDDLKLAEALAEAIALALDHALLYEEARRQAADLSALYTVTRVSSQSFVPEDALPQALSFTVVSLNFDAGLIGLIDPKTQRLHLMAEHQLPTALSERIYNQGLETVLGLQAYDYSEVLLISDLYQDTANYPQLADLEFGAYASMPLIHQGQLLGIMCLFARQPHDSLKNDLGLLASIGYQMSTSVANARLFRAVTDERSRLRAIIETSRDGVVLIGTDQNILVANAPVLQLLNLPGTPDDWIHRPLQEVLSALAPKASGLVEVAVNEITRVQEGDPSFAEGEHEIPPNTIYWSNLPVRAGNAVVGRLLVLRDITEERQLEQMRSDLTRTMVHDLRSPLGNILTALTYLEQDLTKILSNDSDEFHYVNIAQKSTEKMLRLVNNILDVSQLESGRIELNYVPILLPDHIAQAIHTQLPQIQEKNLNLESEIFDNLPFVTMDIELIDQVLQNLLDNAIKFTPNGGSIKVIASAPSLQKTHSQESPVSSEKKPEHQATQVQIAVSDNGPGISTDLQGRLFQKFVTGNHNRRGNGLGLAYCKLAVEAHGGEIWVESELNQGTTFFFTLPIQPSPSSETLNGFSAEAPL